MKILFASHSSELAGAEQSLIHLVHEAAARGHKGKVSLPSPGPLADRLNEYASSFDRICLPTHLWMGRRYSLVVGVGRILQALGDLPGYVRHLRSEKYDVVVVNSSVTPVPLLSAFLTRVPVLLVVRESLSTNPMLRSALPKRAIRWLLSKWSSDVICISEYVSNQFAYPNTVIYPQVAGAFFQKRDTQFRNEHALPRAIMFGTISPEKGQLDALQAIKCARDLGTEVSLEVYGNGKSDDVARLRHAVRKLGLEDHVRVMGPTSTVIEAYGSSDVALVCSRNEGFGKVTAEAILMNRPVVAYDLGGTSEILAYGGGVAVEPTPESMGRALHDIFTQPHLLDRLKAEASTSRIRDELASSARQVVERIEALSVD